MFALFGFEPTVIQILTNELAISINIFPYSLIIATLGSLRNASAIKVF